MMFTSTTTTIPWTPRHEFAARAMEVILRNSLEVNTVFEGYTSFSEMIADQAVTMADEMLKALEEEQ